jgi:hypothetical protein
MEGREYYFFVSQKFGLEGFLKLESLELGRVKVKLVSDNHMNSELHSIGGAYYYISIPQEDDKDRRRYISGPIVVSEDKKSLKSISGQITLTRLDEEEARELEETLKGPGPSPAA